MNLDELINAAADLETKKKEFITFFYERTLINSYSRFERLCNFEDGHVVSAPA